MFPSVFAGPRSCHRLVLLTAVVLLSCLPVTGRSDNPTQPDEESLNLHWKDARTALGQAASITGMVQSVKSTKTITFLNFDESRSADFVVVIRRENLQRFLSPPAELYEGQIVRVRGVVTTYRDRPEIIVTAPEQIEIVDHLPPRRPVLPPREADPAIVTVATYNVLNFFDAENDPYHADESTPAKPRAELENLARTIHALDADVLALQEVENRGCLERFRDTFLSDMGYREIVLFEGNDVRGIDVAVLSRLPVGVVRSHRHVAFPDMKKKPRTFERDLLAVTIEPPGAEPFEVWVVHLKSNYEGREHAEPIRIAEGQAIRRLLDEALGRNPMARILLTGDFNDLWTSITLKTIVGTGDTAMACPLEDVEADTVTYNKPPYRSMIDFVLFSPAMEQQYIDDSYQVVSGTVVSSGSDHNPVKARFRVEQQPD